MTGWVDGLATDIGGRVARAAPHCRGFRLLRVRPPVPIAHQRLQHYCNITATTVLQRHCNITATLLLRRPWPPLLPWLQVRDKLVAVCLARGVVFRYNASVEGLQLLQPEPEAATTAAAAAAEEPQMASTATAAAGTPEEAPAGPGGTSAGGDEGSVRRRKKGRGPRAAGAPTVAAADACSPASHSDAPFKARWLCRLGDGTEHVTDKLVRTSPRGLCLKANPIRKTPRRRHHLHNPKAYIAGQKQARRMRLRLTPGRIW
jgi:hypothetical protein